MSKKVKIIIAVVLVIAVSVGVYFYMKKRKEKAAADAPKPGTNGASTKTDANGGRPAANTEAAIQQSAASAAAGN